MPLFDYLCRDCGRTSEILLTGPGDRPHCRHCGSEQLDKQLSAPSSMSGTPSRAMPGPGDTACCGSSPGEGNCAGPGSCCGRNIGS